MITGARVVKVDAGITGLPMSIVAIPPSPTAYTPEEVARLSDETGKLYELLEGQLVEKKMSAISNGIAAEIAAILRSVYPKSKAYLLVEQPTYCFANPKMMRRPDVALVWVERLPDGLGIQELQIAPDLAVEVVSPTNTYYDVHRRVEEWLSAGVPVVWVVDPVQRDVYIHRKVGTVDRVREAESIRDEPTLPELIVKVADVFPAEATGSQAV